MQDFWLQVRIITTTINTDSLTGPCINLVTLAIQGSLLILIEAIAEDLMPD